MALTYLSTQTASSSSSLSFTSGIDSTYDAYEFHYVNMHPATNDVRFQFQVETGTDSDYDHPMTTTFFQAYHDEADSTTFLGYSTGNDQATSGDGNGVFSRLAKEIGNDNDQSVSGILTLYAPSSTTYVKHFTNTSNTAQSSDYAMAVHTAGYINITAAITRVKFEMSSGNIDAGKIHMYGVS